jgi:hypothetical protein
MEVRYVRELARSDAEFTAAFADAPDGLFTVGSVPLGLVASR